MKTSFTKTRSSTLAWLAVAMLASTGALPAQIIPGRYIAVLKAETRDTLGTANALAGQHGLQLDHVYTKAIKGFAFAGTEPAAQALARRAEVAYVEPDQVFTAFQQMVPTGIRRCDAEAVPGLITGGGLTVDADVAVIDSGLDGTHPDLNVQPGGVRFYQNKSRLITDNNWQDDNGHGTHVGGIIGARDNDMGVVGVAPGVRLWPVKVLDSGGGGALSAVLAGIDWVVQRAATFEVANMSLGGSFSQAVNDAVKAGTAAGIVFVVAAGNSGDDVAGVSPASEPTALTVSALDDNDGLPGSLGGYTVEDELDDTLAWWSNDGQVVDVCAPGTEIYSTFLMSQGGYATESGTSMAAPHVAGAAALYIARHGLTKNAAGVEAVCAAIRDSGWHTGHYAYFCHPPDSRWYMGTLFDVLTEPLLDVAALLYWNESARLSIAAPADATKVAGQTPIQVTTTAPGVTAVQFYLDGQWMGQGTAGSGGWTLGWDTTTSPDGVHTLVAVATDGASQLAGQAILVGVNNQASLAPATRILAPYYDAWIAQYVEVIPVCGVTNLRASAFDLGPVQSVEFYYGGALVGACTLGPTGWTLGWDTTQIPYAEGDLIAVAIGQDGSRAASMAVPVVVDNRTIHIGNLERASSVSGGQWIARVRVTVHNAAHNPVVGATVYGTWSVGGTATPLVTDATGRCILTSSLLPKKTTSVTLTVTSVTPPSNPPGLQYEASLNHDTDGGSDGTTITVPKP